MSIKNYETDDEDFNDVLARTLSLSLLEANEGKTTSSNRDRKEKKTRRKFTQTEEDYQIDLATAMSLSVKSERNTSTNQEWVSIKTYPAWKKDQVPDTVVIRECGGGGDCLFYTLARGITTVSNPQPITVAKMRSIVAEGMDLDYVLEKLPYYTELENQRNEYTIRGLVKNAVGVSVEAIHDHLYKHRLSESSLAREKTKYKKLLPAFQELVRTTGPSYQGTESDLMRLASSDSDLFRHIGYMILDSRLRSVCQLIFVDEKTTHLMLLFNIQDYHWMLVGIRGKGEQVRTLFEIADLPGEIAKIWKMQCQNRHMKLPILDTSSKNIPPKATPPKTTTPKTTPPKPTPPKTTPSRSVPLFFGYL